MGKKIRFDIASVYMPLSSTEWNVLKAEAVRVLSSGGLVVLPTETSYLLGADATNKTAIKRLMLVKGRPEGMPLSVAFPHWRLCCQWCHCTTVVEKLAEVVFPGPVTFILYKKPDRRLYASPGDTIGIRIPDYPYLQDLLAAFGRPVTATSANRHGDPEPYRIKDCVDTADFYWNAGTLSRKPPSTIMDFTSVSPRILREGAYPPEKLVQLWSDITAGRDINTSTNG